MPQGTRGFSSKPLHWINWTTIHQFCQHIQTNCNFKFTFIRTLHLIYPALPRKGYHSHTSKKGTNKRWAYFGNHFLEVILTVFLKNIDHSHTPIIMSYSKNRKISLNFDRIIKKNSHIAKIDRLLYALKYDNSKYIEQILRCILNHSAFSYYWKILQKFRSCILRFFFSVVDSHLRRWHTCKFLKCTGDLLFLVPTLSPCLRIEIPPNPRS